MFSTCYTCPKFVFAGMEVNQPLLDLVESGHRTPGEMYNVSSMSSDNHMNHL